MSGPDNLALGARARARTPVGKLDSWPNA